MRDCAFLSIVMLAVAGCGGSSSAPVANTPVRRDAGARENRNPTKLASSEVANEQPAIATPPAPAEALNLEYLPDDAFVVITLNARRMFQSKALTPFATDDQLAAAIAQWKLDPREIEYLLLFITPPVEGEPLGTPYSPGAVMRFVGPVDGRELVATRGAVKQVKIAGKSCLTQPSQPATAFYLPDPRTIVFAAEKQLAKMLSPTHVKNPLAPRLVAMNRNRDLHALINLVPLAPALPAIVEAAHSQLAQSAWPFVDRLPDISTLEATCDFSGDVLLSVSIEARDTDAAARLHKLARQSRQHAEMSLGAIRRISAEALDAKNAPLVLGLIDEIPRLTTVAFEPTRLRIETAKPSSFDHLGDRLHAELQRHEKRR